MAERIVFDLDGTLIQGSIIDGLTQRPGSTELLSRVMAEGNTPILWSTGPLAYVNSALSQTRLEGFFSEIYAHDHLPAVDLTNLTSIQARTWKKTRGRVKIPPLVGSRILVDDTAIFRDVIELARVFDFMLIDRAHLRTNR